MRKVILQMSISIDGAANVGGRVRAEVVAGAFGGARQQRPVVRQHDGIVVDVDDPAVGRGGLRHLVGVAGGRDPGAYSPCGGLGAGKVSSYAGWP